MCATYIPSNVAAADAKVLNPSIGRIRFLMNQWSCSTMFFKYLRRTISTGIGQPNPLSILLIYIIGSAFIDDNLSGKAVGLHHSSKELRSCWLVSALRKHDIKRFALLIDCTVEIYPRAFHLDVGLVHSPRAVA